MGVATLALGPPLVTALAVVLVWVVAYDGGFGGSYDWLPVIRVSGGL